MKQIELNHTGYRNCIAESDTARERDALRLPVKRLGLRWKDKRRTRLSEGERKDEESQEM